MALQAVVPTLYVTDIAAAVAFYVKTLGFTCANQLEGWATVSRDGVEVMFSLPNAHMPFDGPRFTGSFYFRTDAVDALWTELKETTNVLYPVEDFSYGMREFAIVDLNGYVLQFGQSLDEG